MTKNVMRGTASIAKFESIVFVRNKVVIASSIFVPLLFAVALLRIPDSIAHTGALAALQVAVIAGLGNYVTATTTLASRRESHYLKRLRGTRLTKVAILAGIALPVLVVNLVQIAVVLVWLSISMATPTRSLALIAGTVLVEALLIVLAVATSGVTSSPEYAQITTVPVFTLLVGLAIWDSVTVEDGWEWLRRMVPGGGAIELISSSWGDLPMWIALLDIVVSTLWIAAAAYAAPRLFRWDTRMG